MKNEKSKHTPGPWSVNDVNSSDIYGYEAGTRRGRFIAGTVNHAAGNCCHTEEDRANARLIAAAPDLLMALENVLSAVAYNDEPARDILDLDEIRAAIAKAKGE